MDHLKIIQEFKSGQFKPVYFLHGEEPYFIDLIVQHAEKQILSEAEKSFNQVVLYGKETSFMQVMDQAKQYPMMAPMRVVIVKEAQHMRDIKQMQRYVEQPSDKTLLIFSYKHKKLDARLALAKSLKKHAVIFESKKLYDNKIPGWVETYVRGKGKNIAPKSSALLGEYLGSDLSKLANELDKLFIQYPDQKEITDAMIQQNIGISKEYNVFEFQKAMGEKNRDKAFRMAFYFAANAKKNPLVMIIASLYSYFTKVWLAHAHLRENDQALAKSIGVYSSFFVKEYRTAAANYSPLELKKIFRVLRYYDQSSKGMHSRSSEPGEILKEMTYKILSK